MLAWTGLSKGEDNRLDIFSAILNIQGVQELLDTLQSYVKQELDSIEIKCL